MSALHPRLVLFQGVLALMGAGSGGHIPLAAGLPWAPLDDALAPMRTAAPLKGLQISIEREIESTELRVKSRLCMERRLGFYV
jgi:hypothetical protein